MDTPPKTVLIVDDETYIRQSLVDHFEDHLWQTISAESGEQALALLEKFRPDGAIVDIRLGGMDGNEFIRQAHQHRPHMVFVICTGSPEYYIPPDLAKLPCLSTTIYTKPVSNMMVLNQELLSLIMESNR